MKKRQKLTKSCKGLDIVEIHDRTRAEGTLPIDEKEMINIYGYMVLISEFYLIVLKLVSIKEKYLFSNLSLLLRNTFQC